MTGSRSATEGRRYLPRPTVRLRLTLVYGALFTACGGALLAIVYVLSRTSRFIAIRDPIYYHGQLDRIAPLLSRLRTDPAQFNGVVSRLQQRGVNVQSVIDLHRLLLLSAFAFAFMVLVSVVLGWVVAGRVLRPLRRITYTAQQISSSNLDQRIALDGPDDELRELGFTFDQLPHLTRRDGITYAMGYCGSGVALGSWMGTLAGEWITRGAQPAFSDLRFPRIPFYRGHPWFLPLVGVYYSLLDRF